MSHNGKQINDCLDEATKATLINTLLTTGVKPLIDEPFMRLDWYEQRIFAIKRLATESDQILTPDEQADKSVQEETKEENKEDAKDDKKEQTTKDNKEESKEETKEGNTSAIESKEEVKETAIGKFISLISYLWLKTLFKCL